MHLDLRFEYIPREPPGLKQDRLTHSCRLIHGMLPKRGTGPSLCTAPAARAPRPHCSTHHSVSKPPNHCQLHLLLVAGPFSLCSCPARRRSSRPSPRLANRTCRSLSASLCPSASALRRLAVRTRLTSCPFACLGGASELFAERHAGSQLRRPCDQHRGDCNCCIQVGRFRLASQSASTPLSHNNSVGAAVTVNLLGEGNRDMMNEVQVHL